MSNWKRTLLLASCNHIHVYVHVHMYVCVYVYVCMG